MDFYCLKYELTLAQVVYILYGNKITAINLLELFLMDDNIIFISNQCPKLAQFAYENLQGYC